MRSFAFGFSSLLLASCGSFSGGDSEPANANDAGASDATATNETSTGADAEVDDAPSDAGVCPAGAFCDGFERQNYVGEWSEEGKLTGVLIETDGKIKNSGMRSVRFDVQTTTLDGRQCLTRGLDPNATKVTVSYAVRMTAAPELAFLTIEMGPLDSTYYDSIALSAGASGGDLRETINLPDGGFDNKYVPASLPPNETFRSYTLTVDLTAKEAKLVDESSKLEAVLPLLLEHQKFRAIRIGVAYTGADARTTPASVWFDDIVIR